MFPCYLYKGEQLSRLLVCFSSHNGMFSTERIFYRALDKKGVFDDNFFRIFHLNNCCDPSSELSCHGSDEGSQHMFLYRINKNYPLLSPNTPSYLELSSRRLNTFQKELTYIVGTN